MVKVSYPRGSEWRKWDLQVQTILDDGYVQLASYYETLKEQQPKLWESFVNKVDGEANALRFDSKAYFNDGSQAKLDRCRNYCRTFFAFLEAFKPELSCIGITDHNYFDAQLLDVMVEYSSRATCKVIPGVEINCGGIHLLLLFSRIPCKQSSYSEGVTTLLKSWEIYSAKTNDVLTVTSTNIKQVIDDVRREGGLVVFPHCNSSNGLFQERGKTDRTHLADIFNHQPINLLQSQHRESMDVVASFISANHRLRSDICCHISSDSRCLQDIGRPDKSGNFLWIKADPTFEGLKQILLEPKLRVHMGPTPPYDYDLSRVIDSVTISDGSGWFDDQTILLNHGLVSIIGQKGSGKSALAELIAYCGGSWHSNDKSSFISRAGRHLQHLQVRIDWAQGDPSQTFLGTTESDDGRIRYLSQRFVEHLCAEDRLGSDLILEIESVIFSYLDPSETLNASTFAELRQLRTSAINAEGRRMREDILKLIQEECSLRSSASKLDEKKVRLKALADEREGLTKQLPKPASEEEARIQKEIRETREKLANLQEASAADKRKLQVISNLRLRVAAQKSEFSRFYLDAVQLLREAGVPESEYSTFLPAFPSDTEPRLSRREGDLRDSLAKREGNLSKPELGTIRQLQEALKALLEKDSADRVVQQRVKTIQARLAAIAVEEQRITAEVQRILGSESERIKFVRAERCVTYANYFRNLTIEQELLEELYAPVRKELVSAVGVAHEQKFDFSITREVDIERWIERGSVLFDQRKPIPYGNVAGIRKAASSILLPAWISGDPDTIGQAHQEFISEFRKVEFADPRKYLRTDVSVLDVLSWLYEVDHIRLTYGLKYNNTELNKLSPGTKGMVLLILYLGMDVKDTRPLIIDQPDENLDNESIFRLLTTYFKAAKMRRQIILITHNPNLVVNGDSEQVIVARAAYLSGGLPHITYTSGSLENNSPEESGIRQQVCRILEGGSDAFRRRESRYALAASGE